MNDGPRDDIELAAGLLACLPGMTAGRLRDAVERWDGPVGALDAIRQGRGRAVVTRPGARPEADPDLIARRWRDAARDERIVAQLRRRSTRIYVRGRPGYPIADDVPAAPAVLLAEGAGPGALERPRVAVVGTRAATPHGLVDAHEVGAELARAGATVVSGLAIGIDAAAHEGALDAGGQVVGVLATGLDVVYPRRHDLLFERVRRSGLLVSELGYGVGPRREQFPVRNRIIAGLADVVVIVEATLRGGARITAEHALEYGRRVLAIPGSRRNPAAAGTNALIADGAHPLLDPTDLAVAIGLATVRHPVAAADDGVSGDGAVVLRACGGESATLDQLASRTGLALGTLSATIRDLERGGHVRRADGMYWPM